MKIVQLSITVVVLAVLSLSAHGMMPDFYSEAESVNKNRAGLSLAPNEVIDPFSGGLSLVHTDMVVPGNGGMDIKIQRVYSSNNVYYRPPTSSGASLRALTETTPYGVGWSMHFGRIRMSSDYFRNDWRFYRSCGTLGGVGNTNDNPVFEMPDGSQRQAICNDFPGNYSTNARFVTKDNWVVDPIGSATGTTGFLVTDPNGMKYTMNYQLSGGTTGTQDQFVWYTTKIEDRNGNVLTVSYDTDSEGEAPLFNRIQGSDGRDVRFFYSNANDARKAKLLSIKHGSRTISYTHVNFTPDYLVSGGRQYSQLVKVTLPGGNINNKWESLLSR